MTRKSRKSNWGHSIARPLATEFELQARRLQLTPEMYVSSRELRLWCLLNSNRCYVPEWLLAEWSINVDSNFKGVA
jgi:hypothetical protein